MNERSPVDDTPLVRHAESRLWANPEENGQYQVKMVRITPDEGVVVNFGYMGKWRSLPREKRTFHIFTVAGLVPGYWNFRNNVLLRNPLDRWVNAGRLCKTRGVMLDLYDEKGFQYPRSYAWIMHTYDGLTLIAFEKFPQYPIPSKKAMWFRCYTPSSPVDKWENSTPDRNPYEYECMRYSRPDEMQTFMAMYNRMKSKPGYTGVFHNGAFFKGAPNAIPDLKSNDLVEIWHDPTVLRVETYAYSSMFDFYSELDKKRKVIVHPPKRKGDFTLRYFDDNDYFMTARNNRGLMLPRYDVTAVRQLTHADVAIADEFVQNAATYHPDLAKVENIQITVLVRKSSWQFDWPQEHQRFRYLYRLPDADILRAMTGPRALVPEWEAKTLEAGAVSSFTRLQWNKINRENSALAEGYNAATRVLAETPLPATYAPGTLGIDVPYSYRESYTAWEYDDKGHLIGYYNAYNRSKYSPVNPECVMVEFVVGEAGREFDITITNVTTKVDPNWDLRVYTVGWSIVTNTTVGDWIDVTDDKTVYDIENGNVVWKGLDTVNKRGILVTNKKSIAYTFQLEHIDHSLSFALTDIYVGGGHLFPYSPAEFDLWMNKHPLIENVDWLWRDGRIYVHNKEFIVDGPQEFTVRAHSFYDNLVRPNSDTELGFVDGGCIGRTDRYNLRGDRVTRTVINGALYFSDSVPRTERLVPADQWAELNGRPYCVKHIYAPIKSVVDYKHFPLRARSRETDQNVSDYLTEYLPKPRTLAEEIHYEKGDSPGPIGTKAAITNIQDKYRLFSPFMNAVTNAILNKLLTVPEFGDGETTFSEQQVRDLVKQYIWWLEFDPLILNYDLRFFAVMPYANFEMVEVTAPEFVFLKIVNRLFLKSACHIEGHYGVTKYGR